MEKWTTTYESSHHSTALPATALLVAIAYESQSGIAVPENEKTFMEGFKSSGLNPSCELCGSQDLHTEDRATIFHTMKEAKPFLEKSERDHMKTREYFRSTRQ